jgi:hypothetical protein
MKSFLDKSRFTIRNAIILIQSLLSYWLGLLKETEKKLIKKWMPINLSYSFAGSSTYAESYC